MEGSEELNLQRDFNSGNCLTCPLMGFDFKGGKRDHPLVITYFFLFIFVLCVTCVNIAFRITLFISSLHKLLCVSLLPLLSHNWDITHMHTDNQYRYET